MNLRVLLAVCIDVTVVKLPGTFSGGGREGDVIALLLVLDVSLVRTWFSLQIGGRHRLSQLTYGLSEPTYLTPPAPRHPFAYAVIKSSTNSYLLLSL